MQKITDKLVKFIKGNRILSVFAVMVAADFLATLITGLLQGDVMAGFNRGYSGQVLSGIIAYPIIIAIAFVVYVVMAYVLSYVLRNPKPGNRRNTLKALLAFRAGDAVIGIFANLLTFVLNGGSLNRVSSVGGLSIAAGVVLLVYFAWLMITVDVVAKIHNVSWLKGCGGIIIAGVVLFVIIAVLGLIGLGGAISLGGFNTGIAR